MTIGSVEQNLGYRRQDEVTLLFWRLRDGMGGGPAAVV